MDEKPGAVHPFNWMRTGRALVIMQLDENRRPGSMVWFTVLIKLNQPGRVQSLDKKVHSFIKNRVKKQYSFQNWLNLYGKNRTD